MGDWMQQGMDKGVKKQGSTSMRPAKFPRLYVPIDTKTKIVLLDDVEDAVQVYEHGVFIQGDKQSKDLKVTCLSAGEDPVPTKCRVCGAMIKDERIYRSNTMFLTCVSLDSFVIEGTKYTHIKKLVPLNVKAAKKLLQRKKDLGSLKGAMFSIYRSDQTSPRVGDDWQFIKRVNLIQFFNNSPRLKQLIKNAKKRGENLSLTQALKDLITPFDYKAVLAPSQKKTDYFLGYLGMGSDQVSAKDESVEEEIDYDEDETTEAEDFSEFEDDADEPVKPLKKKKKVVKKKIG